VTESSPSRREVLKRAALGGALIWSVPVIETIAVPDIAEARSRPSSCPDPQGICSQSPSGTASATDPRKIEAKALAKHAAHEEALAAGCPSGICGRKHCRGTCERWKTTINGAGCTKLDSGEWQCFADWRNFCVCGSGG
jgi:hypothetical protein